MARTQPTPETVLDTALELFNQAGTAAVSTNHIAAAAQISPGNLYYHFQNKEDIIRAILERMYAEWNAIYTLPASRPFGVEVLRQTLEQNFALLWRYRFFYRELGALLRTDPQLGKRYRAIQRQRQIQQLQLVDQLTTAGVLRRPRRRAEIEEVLTVSWIVGDHWLSYLETGGERVTPEKFRQGIDLILRLFAPYLTE